VNGYDGPERRTENIRAHERADKAYDKATDAMSRIERHESECVLYRKQTGETLARIEAMLANIFGKAWKIAAALIVGLLSLVAFLAVRQLGW